MGIRGRVTAGPTCPVVRPDHPCLPNPVKARVEAIDSSGRSAGSAMTDGAGSYAIPVPPGVYTVSVDPGGPFPRCPETQVVVSAGTPPATDIVCDTGIR